MTAVAERQTKYCREIEAVLRKRGHATNAELLHALQAKYETLSATTVHRATARLASRGQIGIAPPAPDGSIRYDARTTPHDHFLCNSCGVLRDADIMQRVIPIIEEAIADCNVSGRLTVTGICKTCARHNKEVTL